MALTKTHIIHMVAETVVIASISVYFIMRMNKLDNRVVQLENHVRTLYQKNNLLEKVLQELINIMPGPTKDRISKIVNGQREKIAARQPVYTPQNTPPPQTPPPPQNPPQNQPVQSNPLESIMSMMAPMMSSMIIGGNDENVDIDVASDISEQVSDAEISKELQDLQSENELDESDHSESGESHHGSESEHGSEISESEHGDNENSDVEHGDNENDHNSEHDKINKN